jgi:hypothetical protein
MKYGLIRMRWIANISLYSLCPLYMFNPIEILNISNKERHYLDWIDMKINNQNKLLIGAVCILMLLLMVGCVQAVSVDVGGWNFNADLGDQWRSGDPQAVENDENNLHGVAGDNSWTWRGVMLNGAFWLPKEGIVLDPEDLPSMLNPNQNDLLGTVDISVHRVPEELKDMDAKTKLEWFGGPSSHYPGYSIKEIEFNGHQARLYEIDSPDQSQESNGYKGGVPAYSSGTIDMMMTDDMLMTIAVTTRPDSGLHAWDVIEKFMVSKK